MFNLNAQEMEQEPIDQFRINLFIDREIALQKQRMEKYAGK